MFKFEGSRQDVWSRIEHVVNQFEDRPSYDTEIHLKKNKKNGKWVGYVKFIWETKYASYNSKF